MTLPSIADINKKRVEKFKDKMTGALQGDISFYENLIEEYLQETQVDPRQLAAALAMLNQGSTPLLKPEPKFRPAPAPAPENRRAKIAEKRPKTRKSMAVQLPPEEGMERFRIDLGNDHGIKPGNIVGAIANEADINSKYIGRISIYDNYSTVDLPFGMPDDILRVLQRARIGSKPLKLQKLQEDSTPAQSSRPQKPKGRTSETKKKDQRKNLSSTATV
jgi:ATP-dependent RNA helicase DeaD